MADFKIDTRDLDTFARSLRKESLAMGREIRSGLKTAAEMVATESRALAEQHSTKIAKTIRTRALSSGEMPRVVIEAGGKDAPEAYLFERGNRGSRPDDTTFRHPVFGDRENWVEQGKHPFIRPVLIAKRDRALQEMHKSVQSVVDRVGPKA